MRTPPGGPILSLDSKHSLVLFVGYVAHLDFLTTFSKRSPFRGIGWQSYVSDGG